MSDVIHWQALTPEQRDRLIHEKVMNEVVRCPGMPATIRHRNPSRIPGQYFESAVWICPVCGRSESSEAPKEHDALREIPRYTQSVDAAWLVVEHVREKGFDAHIATALLQYDVLIIERRHGGVCVDASTASAPEALCIAALRAVGCEVID